MLDGDVSSLILSAFKGDMIDDDCKTEEKHPQNILASLSMKKVVTAWKGQIVPMNDHSDKEAVLYTDPKSNRHYRFILHRRNHQKADNYACARCKSRKKYVRILIAGEYFLEDPACLDHICYLNQEELREVREKSLDQKNKDLLKERQKIIAQLQNTKECKDFSIDKAENVLIPNIARLLENNEDHLLKPSQESIKEEEEFGDVLSSSLFDTFFKALPKRDNPGEPLTKKHKRDDKLDPEPQEPTPQVTQPPTSDVFSISLKRALDGLLPENRAKAENEILRFVYSTLYEKYGPS